jgi:hypothetical protein
VWVALALAVGSGALTALLLWRLPNRWIWAAAASVLGLTAAARLVDLAPPSAGRLAERMDGLDLPLFEKIDERRVGHSWCSPSCPRVIRTYDAPDTAPFAAIHAVVLALARKKIDVAVPPRPTGFRVRKDDVIIEARAREADGDVTVVLDYKVVEDDAGDG